MPDDITIKIDGQEVIVPEGTTLLQAANSIDISIPSICYHDHCKPNAVCRTCVVELEGERVLAASCVTKVSEGMIVHTQTDRVKRSRRTILEMLNSAVDLADAPEILNMLDDYNASSERFPSVKERENLFSR